MENRRISRAQDGDLEALLRVDRPARRPTDPHLALCGARTDFPGVVGGKTAQEAPGQFGGYRGSRMVQFPSLVPAQRQGIETSGFPGLSGRLKEDL